MREILFRGKRADNGEWVEGQLLYFKASTRDDELALIVESCEWDNSKEWFNLCKRVAVIPETVGQWTGLTDKNGKKIFDGDIVNDGYNITPIKFGRHKIACCGCCYQYHETVGFYADYGGEDYDGHIIADETIWGRFRVIGNIHDNPELLEENKI
jgi:uncharacterized phage protein (TIGR01671 family)